ncbi:MAG: type II secretion system F family protein [Anaerolineales bacterium]
MASLSFIDSTVLLIGIGSLVIIAGIVLTFIGVRTIGTNNISRRLNDFVAEPIQARVVHTPVMVQQVFSGSIFRRVFSPLIKSLVNYFYRYLPAATIAELDRKLLIAKNPFGLRAREFNGLRYGLLFLGIFLAFLLNYPSLGQLIALFANTSIGELIKRFSDPLLVRVYLGIAIILILYLLPSIWLNMLVRKSISEIRYTLPDALDMLSVCADAGLGFDQALQRVSDYWQTAISEEFRRVINEMEIGVSRAEALRNMSDRLRIDELSSFVAVIIQSELLGMRIADVLHGQAEQMRILRHLRAKEIAYRLPARMIVPLALLILPAIFAVILGPLIPNLLEVFNR